jgi:hypothetical protein
VFDRIFSIAFLLVWAAISQPVIGIVWWISGDYPTFWFRFAVSVLAALAAMAIEGELARRHYRKRQTALPASHRKAPAP